VAQREVFISGINDWPAMIACQQGQQTVRSVSEFVHCPVANLNEKIAHAAS
jgi:hypothetical protein